MDTTKFKIGDRVKMLSACAGVGALKGRIGKVVGISDTGYLGIEFEDVNGISQSDLHNCKGVGKKGHCRFCDSTDLVELVNDKLKVQKKVPTYLVIWDETSKDPNKFFTSLVEAKEFIKALSEKSEVIKDSIILVEIKSAKKMQIKKSLLPSTYKI